jgi:hypothetical protein
MSVEQGVRLGIQGVSSLGFSVTTNQALDAVVVSENTLASALLVSEPIYALIEAGAFPFSSLYGIVGQTGAFLEGYWPLTVSVGVIDSVFVKYVDLEVSGNQQSGSPVSPSPDADTDPDFVYSSGVLVQVTYSNGNVKQFDYSFGVLQAVDYITADATIRKDFNYDGAGKLTSVRETIL